MTTAEKAKHTPGPWRQAFTKFDSDLDIRGPLDSKGASIYIATMSDVDERDANACLIAAAPEMLAALELLVKTIDMLYPKDHYAGLDQARAAIRKARGEQ